MDAGDTHLGRLALVGVGGFVGSVGRYWVAGIVQRWSGAAFPYGTLVVNVLGSFVLGLVIAVSLERGLVTAPLRLFLAVGICGGFTTMSTFSYETFVLLAEGGISAGLLNVVGTFALCVAGVWTGLAVGRIV